MFKLPRFIRIIGRFILYLITFGMIVYCFGWCMSLLPKEPPTWVLEGMILLACAMILLACAMILWIIIMFIKMIWEIASENT